MVVVGDDGPVIVDEAPAEAGVPLTTGAIALPEVDVVRIKLPSLCSVATFRALAPPQPTLAREPTTPTKITTC